VLYHVIVALLCSVNCQNYYVIYRQ